MCARVCVLCTWVRVCVGVGVRVCCVCVWCAAGVLLACLPAVADPRLLPLHCHAALCLSSCTNQTRTPTEPHTHRGGAGWMCVSCAA